jgi:hypothetical protein
MRTPQLRHAFPGLAVAVLFGAVAALGSDRAASSLAVAAQGDFAGLVAHVPGMLGTGGPTVILEAGYRASAGVWSRSRSSSA